jgi:C1A family cysteine protease
MRSCLAEGYPFVFGFTVYAAFESDAVAKSGVLHMPGKKEKVKGGHAVMAVGYNDSQKRFLIRNSWDTDWGMKGYFTMPYAYLTDRNLSDDFWTIRAAK